MNSQLIRHIVLCAALVALCVTGAGLFSTQPAAGQEAQPAALQDAAAIERLKQDGQYESLQAALSQARLNVSRAEARPLGRAAGHALNPAAGIEAEDSEATYPLTIDPIFSLQQKLLAADGGGGDYFGQSVAIHGNTAVVGAPGDGPAIYGSNGAVYVFTRNGSTWTFQQKLTASDSEGGDWFGLSVAIDGNSLVVGAPENYSLPLKQGWAYVFTRSGSIWVEQQKLAANDGASGDHFGQSVAINGDTVVVGVREDDIDGKTDQGSAYVFARNGALWTQQQKLIANDGQAGDYFGHAVALSGNIAVVGARDDDINGQSDQGSAYVFTRNGATWTQQAKLFDNNGQVIDRFGQAVGLDGDTLVVGAYGANNHRGTVYVFTGSSATWTLQQKLTAADSQVSDHFGWSVAVRGDTIGVGAYRASIGANPGQGSAFVFTRSGATQPVWTQQSKLLANDGAPNDFFGWSVAVSGRTVVVGAGGDDITTNNTTAYDQGSAYVFLGPCPTLTFTPADLPSRGSGIWYQQQITVSGGLGPYQFALGSGALPPGISLTSFGLLYGTPTTPGTYQFTIIVDDPDNVCSTSHAYTITIVSCSSITIEPETLPDGATGAVYSQTLTATGGTAPYSFAAKSSLLPAGLSLSQDGVLSGTPTQTGSFYFPVFVGDANGCSGSRYYTLIINDGGERELTAPRLKQRPADR